MGRRDGEGVAFLLRGEVVVGRGDIEVWWDGI
jgi:hypothetical protein